MKAALTIAAAVFLTGWFAVDAFAQIPDRLAREARTVALNGGVTGSCYGCATPRMVRLMKQVYWHRFAEAGPGAQRTAVCLMMAESGGNPAAVSVTSDYGGPQMNRPSHESTHPHWWRPARGFRYLIFDPAFGAGAMFAMSKRGTSWGPWTGTYGRGMCR